MVPHLGLSARGLSPNEFGGTARLVMDARRRAHPIGMMWTCSDMGLAPDELSAFDPGTLIINQNALGTVPQPGSPIFGTSAMLPSTVRHLVVCGHSECGVLRHMLAEIAQEGSKARAGFGHTEDMLRQCAGRPEDEWHGIVLREHVLLQLARLRQHQHVRSMLACGKVYLHGWIRCDRTGTIATYNPSIGQFCRQGSHGGDV